MLGLESVARDGWLLQGLSRHTYTSLPLRLEAASGLPAAAVSVRRPAGSWPAKSASTCPASFDRGS